MEGDLKEKLLRKDLKNSPEGLSSLDLFGLLSKTISGKYIDQIFKYVGIKGKGLVKAKELPLKGDVFVFTQNANIINYDIKGLNLDKFSITSGKIISTFQETGGEVISCVYSSPNSKKYFIGYQTGKLQCLDPSSMKVKQTIQLKDSIQAITTDEKEVYASVKNGNLVHFPFEEVIQEKVQVIDEGSPDNYYSLLKLSRDKSFLVAYVDIDNKEKFYVYNTVQKKMVWDGVLDLSPDNIREDPNKLLMLSNDCLTLFARSSNNKGVTIYSLFDGSIVANNEEMHTNYIFQILIAKDNKTLISAGKDKKIKIWDIIKQKLISVFLMHEDAVETLVLSQDERLLFSGSLDKKVGIWSMEKQFLIANLTTEFPIRTLQLSDYGDYLFAIDKSKNQKSIAYWQLSSDEYFRVNVSLKGVSNCYVTPDNSYLVTMIKNESLTIWNIQSRTIVEFYTLNVDYHYTLRALNGTSDSKYIVFQKEASEISVWECASQQIVNTIQFAEKIMDIVFTKDSKIMYCSGTSNFYKYDFESKEQLYSHKNPGSHMLYIVKQVDDKKMFSTGGSDFQIDLQKDQDIFTPWRPVNDSWIVFEMSPDSRTMVIGSYGTGRLYVNNTETNEVERTFDGHTKPVKMIAFTPDGKFMISRSESESIIWNMQNGKQIITIEEDFGIVTSTNRYCVAVIQDGLYKP